MIVGSKGARSSTLEGPRGNIVDVESVAAVLAGSFAEIAVERWWKKRPRSTRTDSVAV